MQPRSSSTSWLLVRRPKLNPGLGSLDAWLTSASVMPSCCSLACKVAVVQQRDLHCCVDTEGLSTAMISS